MLFIQEKKPRLNTQLDSIRAKLFDIFSAFSFKRANMLLLFSCMFCFNLLFFFSLGFSTFLGMIVLAFAASEVFRIFFRMFLGIVGFGLIHGLCILPVYMSLLCLGPTATRSPTVSVSSERLSSRGEKDETSQNLPVVDIGSENSLAGNDASLKMSEQETCNEEPPNEDTPKGTTMMGISNKGMKTDDEDLNISSEEGNEATQVTKSNEEQHIVTTGENSSNRGDTEKVFSKL